MASVDYLKKIHKIYFSSESIFDTRLDFLISQHWSALYHKGFQTYQDESYDNDDNDNNDIHLQKAASVPFCYIWYIESILNKLSMLRWFNK